MNSLKKFNEIKGNWATLILPINIDGSIDYGLLGTEIDVIISMGVDGIYSHGSAGEFYNITEDEFDRCTDLLANKCQSANMNFQIGVSHMSPIISLERLQRIRYYKPSAVQVILPDWFVPTLDESINFLKRMEEISDNLGMILYNPPHAKKVWSLEDLAFMKKMIPSLIGVKVAGGNLEWYTKMTQLIAKDLSVFIPGHHLATGIKNGAHGAYSNMACLNPKAAQKWYNLTQTDMESALALEQRIQVFMSTYIAPLIEKDNYSNMAMDKLLVQIGNWIDFKPKLRWPYKSVDSKLAEELRPHAKKIIPEFFVKINK
ncbi:dihydrodipicolinate synthase family protein [uncultured Polaribacter sp.]|uniref:dihydrodipicolinate synthase family protein n=1 Tax=uncultured Polaribacter sp. TaxID=174711 RepID=UPI00260B620C|nr:dihydrodipicolinate synthase family protein [uncultured Polaribacter sp.]